MNPYDVAKPLFFIGGCPLSGGRLLQAMLSSHPEVLLADVTGFSFCTRAVESACVNL
jgi:hypothetical protein